MSMFPFHIQGYNAEKISTISGGKLHWTVDFFKDCTDAQSFSDKITSQIGSSLVTANHIPEANTCNLSTNGFNIKYLNSFPWNTSGIWTSTSYAFLSFGPIPIPKSIYFNFYIQLASGRREVFNIVAECETTNYNLLCLKQGHVDGNFGYAGTSGIYTNNSSTKLYGFSTGTSTYNRSSTIDISSYNKCFTNNETSCYLHLIRPNHTHVSGATSPGAYTNILSIRELKIEW